MKNLKPTEVIQLISQKVQLKKDLKLAKEENRDRQAEILNQKISQISEKLSSSPLSKN
jgi:hypothetical protein|tara:strand:- start:3833 stop:4006 length:174 start_codon:yes stop_codon:yes gene_type:complete